MTCRAFSTGALVKGLTTSKLTRVSEDSRSTSSVKRFITHCEDLYDVTDSSWFSVRFQSRVFRFYSPDGTSGRYYVLHKKHLVTLY
jgi:hypothetical protein